MKQINAYQTSDGKLFEDQYNAVRHQKEIDFDEWYCDNNLLGNCVGSYVKLNDLKEWLKDNAAEALDIIGELYVEVDGIELVECKIYKRVK